MNILPHENLTLRTNLSRVEVIERLSDLPTKRNWMGRDVPSYRFADQGNRFWMRRRTGYQNSFLPQISGVIEETANGTTIDIHMRIHIMVVIFMCFWFGGVLCFLFVGIQDQVRGRGESAGIVVPLFMLVAGYATMAVAFKFESQRARRDIGNALAEKVASAGMPNNVAISENAKT